jgi:hypothetical protein
MEIKISFFITLNCPTNTIVSPNESIISNTNPHHTIAIIHTPKYDL